MLERTENIIKTKIDIISDWITKKSSGMVLAIYSSIDIRESNFKIAPVDINLFPGGFNNFPESEIGNIRNAFESFLGAIKNKKIILITEDFSRNIGYSQNVEMLKKILGEASLSIYKISKDNELIHPEEENYIKLEEAHYIILNNDLSVGIPSELLKVSNKIFPNPIYGWHSRRKYNHFKYYNELIDEMCREISHEIDPWILSTYIDRCDDINFKQQSGLDNLAATVDALIEKISEKYKQHSIKDTPHVFIKPNRGTFGMGVTHLFSGNDILKLNKKARHSIHAIKHGIVNDDLIIQEGVPTKLVHDGNPYENIIYSVGGNIIGCLRRINVKKNNNENLNSAGMEILHYDCQHRCAVAEVINSVAAIATVMEKDILNKTL